MPFKTTIKLWSISHVRTVLSSGNLIKGDVSLARDTIVRRGECGHLQTRHLSCHSRGSSQEMELKPALPLLSFNEGGKVLSEWDCYLTLTQSHTSQHCLLQEEEDGRAVTGNFIFIFFFSLQSELPAGCPRHLIVQYLLRIFRRFSFLGLFLSLIWAIEAAIIQS